MQHRKNKNEGESSISVSYDDPIFDYTSKSINIEELKLAYADPAPKGRRIAPRYSVELEVIILTQTRSFRTKSVNLSATGALLQDELPTEFMNSPLDIIFIKVLDEANKKRLLFRGKAVGGPLRTPRITFESYVQDSVSELKSSFKDKEPLPFIA